MNSPAHEYPISNSIQVARAVVANPEARSAEEVGTAIMILDVFGTDADRESIAGKTDPDLFAPISMMSGDWVDDDQESDGIGLVRFVVISAMMSAAGLLYVAIGGAF